MTSNSASTPAHKYIVVHPKRKPKSVAERARDAGNRRRENGQPSISAFDRALREVVLGLATSDEQTFFMPDLVNAVQARLLRAGICTPRGFRDAVIALKSAAEDMSEKPTDEDLSARQKAETEQRVADKKRAYARPAHVVD
jgi:hypothetical protein